MDDELRYKIAITMFQGIGPALISKIIEHYGSIENFFSIKKLDLKSIPLFGEYRCGIVDREEALRKADKEMEFCLKNDVRIITAEENDFPFRLREIPDAPLLIYCKGDIDLNAKKIISMVGTRKASLYGKKMCADILSGLKERGHDLVVVSGLAYGVDVASHRAALDNGFKTVGVVAHGLNQLYPAAHKNIAREMVENGGAVLSDFSTLAIAEPRNFLKRNRIVAGMADALIVVESAQKGGSMITATLANSYGRDVLAIPGKTTDKNSGGCNLLIKQSRASLIENAEDIEYILQWDCLQTMTHQLEFPLVELNDEEAKVYSFLQENGQHMINDIASFTNIPMGNLMGVLLNLELKNMIYSLPGNLYSIDV